MTPALAWATDRTEYDRLIDEALAEFDAGHFEEALSAFEQAYKAKPSARALRGIAKALYERRSYARCIDAIDRAFASGIDPLTEPLRADLESLKTRAQHFIGEAAIDVAPETATVALDGEPLDLAAAKTPLVLDVGTHTLEVTAPDHEPQHRKLEIHGGEVTRITVRLDPVRVFAPPPSSPMTMMPPPNVEERTLPLAIGVGAIVASTGAIVASSIWFVDRDAELDRCNDAAAAGARCSNAGSVAFQRNASLWTIGLSSVALVASTAYLVLRGERRPLPRTTAWSW